MFIIINESSIPNSYLVYNCSTQLLQNCSSLLTTVYNIAMVNYFSSSSSNTVIV